MHARELRVGRTFGVVFDHDEDFFDALSDFCRTHGVRQGYIPMFLGGFAEAELVGTCEKLADPEAPVWASTYVSTVEALGCGTLAYDNNTGEVLPHVHVSVGLKGQSADGRASHLLSARVQFISELFIVEVTDPVMTRPPSPQLFDAPILTFG
jgi:predicted DNA-binding protein with PD1-like motif